MILYVRHARAAKLCAAGLAAWARDRRLSMRVLCREGLNLDDHPELADDPFVQRAVAAARAEECSGG